MWSAGWGQVEVSQFFRDFIKLQVFRTSVKTFEPRVHGEMARKGRRKPGPGGPWSVTVMEERISFWPTGKSLVSRERVRHPLSCSPFGRVKGHDMVYWRSSARITDLGIGIIDWPAVPPVSS